MRTVGLLLLLCVLASLTAVGAFVLHSPLVDYVPIACYVPHQPTRVYDCHGTLLATFALESRGQVVLDQLPAYVPQAFIAAEDWQFYDHPGISVRGIVRSICANMYHGRVVQGASTITQQLVRLLFFGHKKTLSRKLKEQCVALSLEYHMSKQQILTAYLNHLYFGAGLYGIQAAALQLWGVPATQLDHAQAATLAAIIRSPARYSPFTQPEATHARRDLILSRMLQFGYLDLDEYQHAIAQSLSVRAQHVHGVGEHIREAIRCKLERLLGAHELYTGGYAVYTTIDRQLQTRAELLFYEHIKMQRSQLEAEVDGALLCVHGPTGAIRALVGGYDYETSRFNRALQAKRQLGSIIKPLVYAAALLKGCSFADVLIDEPTTFDDGCGGVWRPANHDKIFRGPITRAYALSHSNNIVTIKTAFEAGLSRIVRLANDVGIDGITHAYPSLALGCVEATLDKAVGMINMFAQQGMYVQPHMIVMVQDAQGRRIYQASVEQRRVLPTTIAGKVLKVLSIGMQRARSAYDQGDDGWIDSDAASKTGTTNDFRTCWFVGSTPELTTGIYVGCDDNSSLGVDVYPLQTAFPLWRAFHMGISTSTQNFSYDPHMHATVVHERTGRAMKKLDDPYGMVIYA